MNVNLTEDEIAFRDEVRKFLAEKYPADLRKKQDQGVSLSREDTTRWQKILHEQGWFAVNWPEEYGGTAGRPSRNIFSPMSWLQQMHLPSSRSALGW